MGVVSIEHTALHARVEALREVFEIIDRHSNVPREVWDSVVALLDASEDELGRGR